MTEWAAKLAEKFSIDDKKELDQVILLAQFAIDGIWAKEGSKLDRVANHLEKALALLREPAWATNKLPTGGFDDWTQADMLSAMLNDHDVDFEVYLRVLAQAARAKHEAIQEGVKRTSPGKPHVDAAVNVLVHYWRDTLRRPAYGNRSNPRSYTKKRDDVPGASLILPVGSESEVVEFVADIMSEIASLDGVEHALDKILPRK